MNVLSILIGIIVGLIVTFVVELVAVWYFVLKD